MNYSEFTNALSRLTVMQYPAGDILSGASRGLSIQAGRISSLLQNSKSKGNQTFADDVPDKVAAELEDLFFVIGAISCVLKIDLEVVAQRAIEKHNA